MLERRRGADLVLIEAEAMLAGSGLGPTRGDPAATDPRAAGSGG